MEKMNKEITSRDKDFAKWYTDVVRASHLASYSSVKGCIVIEPLGYAIWENMQRALDDAFKRTGHKNVYMPLLIPENLMKKEGELVNGFAPEVAWVTEGGEKHLDERLCVRPTSETLFSDYYHNVVKSYRDLPLKYNQWCSVFRWEKETRPFLRSREFLWQEGHTVHATNKEAEEEALKMHKIYKEFFENYLAIPVITGRKTEKEKFAGAEYTLTIEALMYSGVALQSATSHYFGNKFAKAYDIKFLNKDNKLEYAYQTSWGSTTRMIGALIMVHSDDYGLVLPPKIAPVKVNIVPIKNTDRVNEYIDKLKSKLDKENITYEVLDDDKSAGYKFAESEVKGVPIRVDVGERDLDKNVVTLTRRDTREKIEVNIEYNDITVVIETLLKTIQSDMYERALERRNKLTFEAHNLDDVKKIMDTQPGFIKAMWCGSEDCENKMKEIKGLKSRCIVDEDPIDDKCAICGGKAKHLVYWGVQY